MVVKNQRDRYHPCRRSSRERSHSSWSWGIVRPITGKSIVWYPGMTMSLFNGCFRGWKSRLRISTMLTLSSLALASAFVRVEIIACTLFQLVSANTTFLKAFITFRQTFLASLFFLWTTKHNLLLTTIQGPVLVLHHEMLFWFLRTHLSLSFSFASFSPHLATLKRSGLLSILVVVPCPKTRSFIINVTLLTSYFVDGSLSRFVFSIIFYDEGSARAAAVSVHSEWRILHRIFRRTEQFHEHCAHCFKGVNNDIHSLERKGTCECLSGLHSNHLQQWTFSWVVTCVAFHLSLVSGASGSRISVFLLFLSSFSWFTSARLWFRLWVSFMADIGNMSIQASLNRFKSSENLPIHLPISMFPLLARINW